MSGDIRRGSLDVIRGVLIYADLRGFTRITDSVERDLLAPMLDAYFERMVPPILERGGQVLKYMGDGRLATFDLTGKPKDAICGDAFAAAAEMIACVRELNTRRKPAGLPAMTLDIAMHLGDVLYGNIGAAGRQDFTVIGPAVNEASRIETLCERLGHDVLISQAFADAAVACADQLIPVGSHELRGIRGARALYTFEVAG